MLEACEMELMWPSLAALVRAHQADATLAKARAAGLAIPDV